MLYGCTPAAFAELTLSLSTAIKEQSLHELRLLVPRAEKVGTIDPEKEIRSEPL